MGLKTLIAGEKTVGVKYPSSWTEEQWQAYLRELAKYLGVNVEDIMEK